jgi:hypothetical protein
MEAYPFAEDISLILSNYWKTMPVEKRADLPGIETIERIRELVEGAFNANPEHAGFLKDFIAKQGDKGMISEFGDRLKHLMYRDPELAKNLEALAVDFGSIANQNSALNVKVEWGDSTVSGSTAEVKQARKVEIDTIDPSKFIED